MNSEAALQVKTYSQPIIAFSMDHKTAQALYSKLINAWNTKDASAFAACFANESVCIGFDGSEMLGRSQIQTQLDQIFKDHVRRVM